MDGFSHFLVNVSLDYAVEILDHGVTHIIAVYGVKIAVIHAALVVVHRVKKIGKKEAKKFRVEPKL